jgi:hypothetical protein
MRLADIKINEDNPRKIKKSDLDKLRKSLENFPEMLQIRPIVVNKDNVILGGNMRFLALKDMGDDFKIPVIVAGNLTEGQEKEFILKDNAAFGEWDYEKLLNQYERIELTDVNIKVPIMDPVDLEPPELSDEVVIKIVCQNDSEAEKITQILTREGIEWEI